jgi:glutathione-regulated potassium-efflux system ancillary protein KefG
MEKPNGLKTTVFFFHPFPRRSRVNRALKEAIQDVKGIELRDMYEIYPDFAIDVNREKEVLLGTEVAVFQHPFYWYSCPALMKEWIDEVLERGWAYGPGGTHLHGKYWIQAITTGGPPDAYKREGNNRFTVREFLRPFEQTARLCGMKPLEPHFVQKTHLLTDVEIQAAAQGFRRHIEGIVQGDLPGVYSTLEDR